MSAPHGDARYERMEIDPVKNFLGKYWKSKEDAICDDGVFERIKTKVESRTNGSSTLRLGLPMIHAIETLRRQSIDRVLQVIEKRLNHKVAVLVERFKAAAAWLYVLEGDGDLVARICHNTTIRTFRTTIDTIKGVVPRVARRREGECIEDVEQCSYYQRGIVETRSEIAVPVLTLRFGDEAWYQSIGDVNDWEVLAVLNLESDAVARFDVKDIDNLQQAANDLADDLICWRAIREDPGAIWAWHPPADDWAYLSILDELCLKVSQTLDNSTAATAIWDADWKKQVLHVRATNGFDNEYRERALPLKSYTGGVCRRPNGSVVEGSPYDEAFIRKDKAEYMGLKELISAPYYASDAHPSEPALGAINVYLFENSPPSACPLPQEMAELARNVGAAITSFEALRKRVAIASLASRLVMLNKSAHVDRAQRHSIANSMTDLLKQYFRAEECSVLIFDLDNELCDESSKGAFTPPGCNTCEAYLARHPGTLIREHVTEVRQQHQCDQRRMHVKATGIEDEQSAPPQQRRFIGTSFALNDTTAVVIRLMRPCHSGPFVSFDEDLLCDLAHVYARVRTIEEGDFVETEDTSETSPSAIQLDETQLRIPIALSFGTGINATARCANLPSSEDAPFALSRCTNERELLGWFYRLSQPLGIKNVRYHFLSPWDKRLVSVECYGHSDRVAARIRAGGIVKVKEAAKLEEFDSYWAFQLNKPVVFQLDEKMSGVLPLDYIDDSIPCFVVGKNQCENVLKGKRVWVDLPMSIRGRSIGKLSCDLSAANVSDISALNMMQLWKSAQLIAPYVAFLDQVGGQAFDVLRKAVFRCESLSGLADRLGEQLSQFTPACDRYVRLFTLDRSQKYLVLAGSTGGIVRKHSYSLDNSHEADYPAPWVANAWKGRKRQSLRLQGLSRSELWRGQASSQGARVRWPDPCFDNCAPENLLTVGIPGVSKSVVGVLQVWDRKKAREGEQVSISDSDQRVVERLAHECIGPKLLMLEEDR